MKPTVQVLAALMGFAVIILLTSPPRARQTPPSALVPLAKFIAERVDPIQLQNWASNVVATRSRDDDLLVNIPPSIRLFPAPFSPWTGRIAWPASTNLPTLVECVSVGGFGGYGLIIGPQWWSDSYERSEMVANGIFIRRYP